MTKAKGWIKIVKGKTTKLVPSKITDQKQEIRFPDAAATEIRLQILGLRVHKPVHGLIDFWPIY